MTKREARSAAAHQAVTDARAALDVSFKHQDALDAARWEVERIGRAMREETPQPSLDPELEALKKRMPINFSDAPGTALMAEVRDGDALVLYTSDRLGPTPVARFIRTQVPFPRRRLTSSAA